MKKTIEELSEQDLKQKIDNIKAERERTANALKKYEDELERRKQEVPLGVPVSIRSKGVFCVSGVNTILAVKENFNTIAELFDVLNLFHSEASAKKHSEMLLAWRKALVANAKGEPIDIKVLLPLLKKGKVLYSPYDEKWKWVEQEAIGFVEEHGWYIKQSQVFPIEGFNLKPADDWTKSLQECGL